MDSRTKKRYSAAFSIMILFSLVFVRLTKPVSAMKSNLILENWESMKSEIVNDQSDPGIESDAKITKLVSIDPYSLSFIISVPWEQLKLDPIAVENSSYIKPSLPGWTNTITPGKPALPFHFEQIGVPFGANVTLSVTPGKAHVYKLSSPLYPVLTQNTEWTQNAELFENTITVEPKLSLSEDPSIYDEKQPYPNLFAEVAGDGILRQQRVVSIASYPLQYHPEKSELVLYESLQINVTFEGYSEVSNRTNVLDSPFYENLLAGQLLNYDTAKEYRKSTQVSTFQLDSEINTISASSSTLPWSPPEPGYRILVRDEGIYRMTYAELAELSLGIPVDSLDPRSFQMYHLGEEIAIQVVGESDGAFDESDYILFYGQEIESKYTRDNVYWLTYDPSGITLGKRMDSRDGSPETASTPEYYSASRHMEENNYYMSWLPLPEDVERWWWAAIQAPFTSVNWTHSFSLFDPFTGTLDPSDEPALLTISVIGYTSYATISTDHHAKVFLNSVEVGDLFFDGREWKVSSFQVDQGTLQAGNNTIELHWVNDTGASYDTFLIDYVRLDYPNRFHAESDVLSFSYETPGIWLYSIEGFSSNQISIFDITDPTNLVSIENIALSSSDTGVRAQFQDSSLEPTRYWATTDSIYLNVSGIQPDQSSNLSTSTNGADYILITHRDFWAQALTLSNHRSGTMRSLIVDVQDIYDEFNYGIIGPEPIRDFLAYAYFNWQAPAPSYVVLMGDGHYDPKQNQFTAKTNFISPYLLPVDPWMGETAADNRYATIVGDDTLPDMMIGRLAVNNSTEANAVVNKIINYEAAPEPGDWQEQILAVADNADMGGNFPGISDYLISTYVDPPYTTEKIYFATSPYTTSTITEQAIKDGINAGKLIVNYTGHAGRISWGAEGFFKTSSIPQLTNGGKLPIMLEMTCFSGSFHIPDVDALAEVASRTTNNGTIANWSATGEGVSSGHIYLNSGFFEAFFQDGIVTLGNATMRGKFDLWSTGGALDLLDTYTLFGDPALMIVRPDTANHPPIITEGSSVAVAMSENGSPVAFSLSLHAMDEDSDPLTWEIAGQALNGLATASGTGSSIDVGYTPDENYSGTDTFIVQVSDGTLTDQIIVNVVIGSINNPPEAVDDNFSTDQNTPFTILTSDLIANDTDSDTPKSELSIIGVSNPINGTVILQDESITFTPDTDFTGTAGFDYTLSDGMLTDIGHVTGTVNALNSPPTALDDSYSVEIDQVLTILSPGVLANDTDSEGDALTALIMTDPLHGSLSLELDGSFVYIPTLGYTGIDTFTYVAYDGQSGSNTATVTITVQPITSQISIPLYVGWNLVSFNVIPKSTAIADVLGSIEGNYTLVYAWDAHNDAWLLYDPSLNSFLNNLQYLDHTTGFWIYMNTADTLELTGSSPTTTGISLTTGWNLVGYPSMETDALPGALTENGVTEYSSVWAYYADDTDHWKLYDPDMPPDLISLPELSPGWGYWINVSSESTWTIP
jgi:hypothetical protein